MLLDLAWLPRAPSDFRSRLQALRGAAAAGESIDAGLHALAAYALDITQLGQLARLATASAASRLPGLRLGVLAAGTQDFTAPAIVATALRHGLRVETLVAEYGASIERAADGDWPLHAADLIFFAPDYRALGLDTARGSDAEAGDAVDFAWTTITATLDAFAGIPGGVLVATLVPPLEPLFGSLDAIQPGSVHAMIAAVNARILDLGRDRRAIVVDMARAAASAGLEHWHDPQGWHMSKLACAPAAIPLYAEMVARTLAAVRGRSRKCLVLDCDNTLWGGVIGDDGLAGIRIGQGSAAGEAFLAVQRAALQLRARGIVLAVASKNEHDAAMLPFRDHPDMLLRPDHIAVFQANWTDKASNLRVIAETLNIGLDALVFLDDNPAERDQVRRELPMVAVPELPDDPALFPRTLMAAGYFEAIAVSDEDRGRADAYRADAGRRAAAVAVASSSDVGSYLEALDMVCDIRRFDAVGRSRIAQLINKSNQFNLTTRRYTEAEVARIEADAQKFALQVRLADRFGDNGMISVVIFDRARDAWTADTWLMSCRVLGRRVEEAVLAHVAAAARAAGARRLIGQYLPSPKNAMVAGHYGKLGFTRTAEHADGSSDWSLDLDSYAAPELPMRIVAPELVGELT